MNDRDRTDEALRAYFRDRIARVPVRPAPESSRRATALLWFARVAVAALIAVALGLPLLPADRLSPSAGEFAAIHTRLGTGEAIGRGLAAATEFLGARITSSRRQ